MFFLQSFPSSSFCLAIMTFSASLTNCSVKVWICCWTEWTKSEETSFSFFLTSRIYRFCMSRLWSLNFWNNALAFFARLSRYSLVTLFPTKVCIVKWRKKKYKTKKKKKVDLLWNRDKNSCSILLWIKTHSWVIDCFQDIFHCLWEGR